MADAKTPTTIIYRGRFYDVAGFLDRHPGGREILERFTGQDVTTAMHMMHDMRQKNVQKALQKLDRGPADAHPMSAFDSDYLALEESFYAQGLFTPNLVWYAYKTLLILALFAVALFVPGPWLKGLFFGLFVQQSAFVAHDICHDAAVPRTYRRRAAWFYGTVCFGLSHDKWQREHTIHHAINSRPFEDPQMNTMPHLLYAFREAEAFETRKSRAITDWEKTKMGFQHLWLLPVLLLYGRINVVKGDVKTAIRTRSAHYLWGYALHFSLWGVMLAQGVHDALYFWPIFIVVTLAVSGMIHLQLILSHAYAPRLFAHEQAHEGMRMQAISNQNITTFWFDDWFHGGLQHHIEHHLFPRLPRHNLAKIRPQVRVLCEKHRLPYRSDPFVIAVRDLMRSLYAQGAPFRAQLAAQKQKAAG